MKKFYTFLMGAILLTNGLVAQNVAINNDGSTAQPTAILDIKSTTKGMLVPRMTKAQKNAITTPANGLLIYQNAPDSIGFYYFNGTIWVWLQNANNNIDWSTNGNATTDTATNFLGTTNSMPLRFKLNDSWAGQWDERLGNYSIGLNANSSLQPPLGAYDSRDNIAFGNNALANNTYGNSNLAIGTDALTTNVTGYGNFAIGKDALRNNLNNDNYAIGAGALFANTTGIQNYAIGQGALSSNTIGINNMAIGEFTLRKNISGNRNLAIGFSSQMENLTGFDNLSIGINA